MTTRALKDAAITHQTLFKKVPKKMDLTGTGKRTTSQSNLLSKKEETTKNEEGTKNSQPSLDASWCLDRSDGTNRSLNQSEIEDRKPSAPNQVYPLLPFNPFFGTSPPPMPINTPHSWDNGPTLGELMEIERQEMEDGATYNHEL